MEARRVEGDDFFYCLTFPYRDTHATFVLGGWGGSVCGISSIDFMDAMDNSTMTAREFEEGKWTWDNGEKFVFKHWGKGQPSATTGYNFLVLDGKDGKWKDTTDFSGKVKGYVCEWKGTAPKDAGPKDEELKPPLAKLSAPAPKKK